MSKNMLSKTNLCKKCGKPGKITDFFHPNQCYCKNCFIGSIRRQIWKSIPKNLRKKCIGIALSGGKDSVTILDSLYAFKNRYGCELIAMTLDEGIGTSKITREENISKLHALYPDVQFIQRSFKEYYGYSLDELLTFNHQQNDTHTPCTICGILKRHALNRMVQEAKIPIICYGTTLNDEIQTYFLNIIRGKPSRLNKYTIYTFNEEVPYQKVQPLARVDEKFILQYCQELSLPYDSVTCINAQYSYRSAIKTFLLNLAEFNPSVLYSIASSLNLSKKEIITKPMIQCEQCSSFTTVTPCAACRLVRKLTQM